MGEARLPAPWLALHCWVLLALTSCACEVPFSISGRCSRPSDCPSGTWCVEGTCSACPSCANGEICIGAQCRREDCVGVECPAGEACLGGACAPGCVVGGSRFAAGDVDPSEPCRTCQPDLSTGAFSPRPDGTPCGTGRTCSSGRCQATCVIGGEAWPSGAVDPASPCRTCQPETASGSFSDAFEGEAGHCPAGEICRSGACVALQPLAFSIRGITGPADGAVDGYLQYVAAGDEHATVAWSASANAARYDVTIFQADGATVACAKRTVTATDASFDTCSLVPGARYLVSVLADNGYGATRPADNSPFAFLVNRQPVAVDDSAIALSDAYVTLPVRGNDSDPDGQGLTVVSVTTPAHGTATTDGASVTYHSSAGYRGDDAFGYSISDGAGGLASATVSLKVALPQTWTGAAGDNSWKNASNWIPPVLPGAADTAHFDSTCSGAACNCSMDLPVSLRGLELAASYTGTLTQLAGNTLTLGSSAQRNGTFVQEAGTFLGSASATTHLRVWGNDSFRLLGGSFRAPAGELRVESNQTSNTPVRIAAGATFQHGSGTFFIGHASGACGDTLHTVDVPDRLSVNHLTLGDSGGGCGGAKTFDLQGRTIDVQGTLRLAGGDDLVSDGNLDLWGSGNVFTRDVGDPRGGTALIRFRGAAAQTYTINQASTGWPHPGFVVDKTVGEVVPVTTKQLVLESLQVLGGTFRTPMGADPVEISGPHGQPHTILKVAPGATLTLGNQALFFSKPGNPGNCDAGGPYLIDVTSSFQANDVHFAMFSAGCTHLPQWQIQDGSVFTVRGRFWAEIGTFSGGGLQLQGSVDVGGYSGGGTTRVSITGPNLQAFQSSGGRLPGGPITIDKTGGSLDLFADFRATTPGQSLTMAGNSIVNMTGHGMTVAGPASMTAPATINKGGGTLTINGSVVGSGSGNMFGTGTVNP